MVRITPKRYSPQKKVVLIGERQFLYAAAAALLVITLFWAGFTNA